MLTPLQREAVETLIRDVGTKCIFPYFRNLKEGDISFKSSPNDPVSVADKEAESLLAKGLKDILPQSLFVGEETYASDLSIIGYLTSTGMPVWVVDPIDGTSNFVGGREGFGPMVALILNGEIISSWLYDVCSNTMTVSHLHEGVTVNDHKFLLPPPPQEKWRGMIGWKLFKLPALKNFRDNHHQFGLVPAADPSIIAYAKLIKGELDFLIYRLTSPWDHLPGILMVTETGGAASSWDGTPHLPENMNNGLIVARSQIILDQVRHDITDQLSQYADVQQMRN